MGIRERWDAIQTARGCFLGTSAREDQVPRQLFVSTRECVIVLIVCLCAEMELLLGRKYAIREKTLNVQKTVSQLRMGTLVLEEPIRSLQPAIKRAVQ